MPCIGYTILGLYLLYEQYGVVHKKKKVYIRKTCKSHKKTLELWMSSISYPSWICAPKNIVYKVKNGEEDKP